MAKDLLHEIESYDDPPSELIDAAWDLLIGDVTDRVLVCFWPYSYRSPLEWSIWDDDDTVRLCRHVGVNRFTADIAVATIRAGQIRSN